MRDIIRPEVLWREAIPLAVVAGIVAVVFLIAFASADNANDVETANAAAAFARHFMGTLIATAAAFGLFWRALNGEPLDLQFGFVLALLAGLLLIEIHWSLAIVLGLIGISLIVRGIIVRFGPATAATASAVDRPTT
jgi:hypothetical protein